HLVEAERCADRLEILRMLACAVEGPLGTDDVRAVGGGRTLRVGRDRGLERRAVEEAGAAGATVVVGDQGVAREEEPKDRHGGGGAEAEDVGGSLAGTAGEQEQRAARSSLRRQLLDVQGDRPRRLTRAVERDVDLRAD